MRPILAIVVFLGLTSIVNAGEVRMAWDYTQGDGFLAVKATSFRIYRMDGCSEASKLEAELTPVITAGAGTYEHVSSGLVPGKKYCWRVSATGGGLESKSSNTISVTMPMPPQATGVLGGTVLP